MAINSERQIRFETVRPVGPVTEVNAATWTMSSAVDIKCGLFIRIPRMYTRTNEPHYSRTLSYDTNAESQIRDVTVVDSTGRVFACRRKAKGRPDAGTLCSFEPLFVEITIRKTELVIPLPLAESSVALKAAILEALEQHPQYKSYEAALKKEAARSRKAEADLEARKDAREAYQAEVARQAQAKLEADVERLLSLLATDTHLKMLQAQPVKGRGWERAWKLAMEDRGFRI